MPDGMRTTLRAQVVRAAPLTKAVRPLECTITGGTLRSTRDIAFAAGLFEGEGCIAIVRSAGRSGNWHYHLRCIVKMTDPEPVLWLHGRWGGSHTSVPASPRRKAATQWATSSREAAAFLEDVAPYLISDRRRRMARLAIEFQAQKVNAGRRARPEYDSLQESFWHEMKAANFAGQHNE